MRKLLIVLGLLAMATSVQASTLSYTILVDGKAIGTGTGVGGAFKPADLGLPATGGTITLTIQAKVVGMDATGYPAGLTQAAFDLKDSTGNSLVQVDKFTTSHGVQTDTGLWDTTIPYAAANLPTAWVQFAGGIKNGGGNATGAETLNIPAANYQDNSSTNDGNWNAEDVAAGVWQSIVVGNYTWNGNTATLSLASKASDNGVFTGGTLAAPTSAAPDVVNVASVNFVPEPVTMTLLAIGGLGLLARRNRR